MTGQDMIRIRQDYDRTLLGQEQDRTGQDRTGQDQNRTGLGQDNYFFGKHLSHCPDLLEYCTGLPSKLDCIMSINAS